MTKISAVIMAAGEGTRLLPLTSKTPKPMIRVLGKSSLERNLDNLLGVVDEVVIVVGYLKKEITDGIGDKYKGMKIRYVEQKKFLGTAHAFFMTEETVKNDQLLVMNGDDIYDKRLVHKLLKSKGSVIVGKKVAKWKNYGILMAGSDNKLERIVEKPKKFVGDLVNIGLYKVKKDFYKCFNKIKLSERGEYEITDMLSCYAKGNSIKILSSDSGWTPLSYPWDLLDFAGNLLGNIRSSKRGTVENGAVIKGKLILGKNSVIRSGAYLDGSFYIGEDCEIGPSCYLRGFGSFDDGVVIGNAVEVKNAIIGKNTKIKHLSYVGDSVIGNGVNLGAGTVISNFRHDGGNVKYKVNGKIIDTGRRKLGAIIGDNAKTGINTTIYPGTRLDSNSLIDPGKIARYGLTEK
jgi:bifunctional UDP-N-acetylglucosamine pyrophosphorylase/glucosamine-1-phosphate N-acetyltransferase